MYDKVLDSVRAGVYTYGMEGRLRLDDRRDEPIALSDRAIDNLTFIRRMMEASGTFTAVSGIGVVAMGTVGLAAAMWAARAATVEEWIRIWSVAAGISAAVGGYAIVRKARRRKESALSGPGRKFMLNFMPAVAAGAALTITMISVGMAQLLPGTWLLMYGTGIVTGGAFSVRIVPAMGVAFMLLGVLALGFPSAGDVLMGVGFGGLHLGFGAIIAWRYGG